MARSKLSRPKPCWWSTNARCFCEYPSFQILHIYDFSVVVCGYLRRLALYANHHKSPLKRRKYSEFGTMCIHVPVKSMPCLFCVMCNVSGRYMTVNIITWCLDRYGHLHDVILNWHQAYSIGGATHTYLLPTCQCFSMKKLLSYKYKNRADTMNGNICLRALARFQPKKWTIRIFFHLYSGGGLRWFVVVCGGLPAFLWFHCLSSKYWW